MTTPRQYDLLIREHAQKTFDGTWEPPVAPDVDEPDASELQEPDPRQRDMFDQVQLPLRAAFANTQKPGEDDWHPACLVEAPWAPHVVIRGCDFAEYLSLLLRRRPDVAARYELEAEVYRGPLKALIGLGAKLKQPIVLLAGMCDDNGDDRGPVGHDRLTHCGVHHKAGSFGDAHPTCSQCGVKIGWQSIQGNALPQIAGMLRNHEGTGAPFSARYVRRVWTENHLLWMRARRKNEGGYPGKVMPSNGRPWKNHEVTGPIYLPAAVWQYGVQDELVQLTREGADQARLCPKKCRRSDCAACREFQLLSGFINAAQQARRGWNQTARKDGTARRWRFDEAILWSASEKAVIDRLDPAAAELLARKLKAARRGERLASAPAPVEASNPGVSHPLAGKPISTGHSSDRSSSDQSKNNNVAALPASKERSQCGVKDPSTHLPLAYAGLHQPQRGNSRQSSIREGSDRPSNTATDGPGFDGEPRREPHPYCADHPRTAPVFCDCCAAAFSCPHCRKLRGRTRCEECRRLKRRPALPDHVIERRLEWIALNVALQTSRWKAREESKRRRGEESTALNRPRAWGNTRPPEQTRRARSPEQAVPLDTDDRETEAMQALMQRALKRGEKAK